MISKDNYLLSSPISNPWSRALKLFLSHILIGLFFFNVWTVGYPGRIVYLSRAIAEFQSISAEKYIGDPPFDQLARMDFEEINGNLVNIQYPGTSFLGAVGAWIYNLLVGARFQSNPLLQYYLISAFVGLTSSTLLYAASVACMYLLLRGYFKSERASLFFTFVYGLCTPVLFYGSRVVEDSVITSLVFISFSCLIFARKSQPKFRPWLLGLSGLSLGYACFSKQSGYFAAPFIIMLFIVGKYYADPLRQRRATSIMLFRNEN